MPIRDGIKGAFRATLQVVNKALGDQPHEADWQSNIGLHHAIKYSKGGDVSELDEAVRATRQALDLTPKRYSPERTRRLDYLGSHLVTRYSATGAISDLDEAIKVTQESLNGIPEAEFTSRLGPLTHLGHYLAKRYWKTGAVIDAEGAVRALRTALNIDQEKSDSGHLLRIGVLGVVLGEKDSEEHDLEDAIRLLREALVRATPNSYPNRNTLLDQLGARLAIRYSRTGMSADLDEAVQVTREVLTSTAVDHVKGQTLENLGGHLVQRYSRTGALADLEDAISLTREALAYSPQGHSRRAARSYKLGLYIYKRYSRIKSTADLEEAVRITQEAVEITPNNDPKPAALLQTLKHIFDDNQNPETKSTIALQRAVQRDRQILAETSESDFNRGIYLLNLGTALSRTGILSDLEEAIEITVQALEQISECHPDRARWLCKLAFYYVDKWVSTDDLSELDHAIPHLQSALLSSNSPIGSRVKAGQDIIWISGLKSKWEMAYEAATTVLDLVPNLALQSLANADKQYVLGQIAGLASDAAAVALHAGKGPRVALDLLERGRGVLAESIENLYTDIVDLEGKHPSLAEEFVRLRDKLVRPAVSNTTDSVNTPGSVSYARVGQRHDLGRELEKLINKIREQPGFDDFLQGPTERQIRAATKIGPIVIINISKYRCDAILVTYKQLVSIPLTRLSIDDLKDKVTAGHLATRTDLEFLWYVAAKPILEALGFTERPLDDHLPHIWWIPTGPMTKFPLHAAGCHSNGSAQTVLDRVMSSYGSSIRAIIRSRKRPVPKPTTLDEALLIGMSHTPERSGLHFAAREVDQLGDICKMMGLEPIRPGRRKQDVLSHLLYCRIFHFAGHGHTDNTDPLQSYLLLNDWKQDRLTVDAFLEMNLRQRPPFLAYLSACGTGQIKDQRFVDESIHLVSACQLVGFRHVIGTLWEVNDESCLEIARITYEEMKDGAMTDESVCRGLHKATRELRNRWLNSAALVRHRNGSGGGGEPSQLEIRTDINDMSGRSDRDVTLCGDSDDDDEPTGSLNWVPYIHFGV